MGVESVQDVERHQGSLSSASKRTREGWQFQSLPEGASRTGLANFIASPVRPRSGGGWSTSQRTNAQQTHAMADLQLQTLSTPGKVAAQGWKLLFRNTAPLCMSPTPRARISRRRSIRFAKRRIHVSILMPPTSQEEALFSGSHGFVDWDSVEAGTQRPHLGGPEEKRGHSNKTPRQGTPVESFRLAGLCWQVRQRRRGAAGCSGLHRSRRLVRQGWFRCRHQ
jgi:hypothetical protein